MSISSHSKIHPRDAGLSDGKVCGLLIIALAGLAGYLARELPIFHQGTVGPGAFPLLLAAGLALSGVLLFFRRPDGCCQSPAPGAAWKLLILLPLFPLLVSDVGSLLALSACGVGVARVISGSWTQALVVGLGLACVLHLLLILGLGVPLPWRVA